MAPIGTAIGFLLRRSDVSERRTDSPGQ